LKWIDIQNAGTRQMITAIGGFFHDFELHERILAEGTADLLVWQEALFPTRTMPILFTRTAERILSLV
jgi:hypothetical protein